MREDFIHQRIVCDCGTVIAECKCPSVAKAILVKPKSCDRCKESS